MSKIIADSIDQLISIEMRYAAELPRGVIRPLYEAARDVQGGEPLVYQAAQALLEHVGQRDTVLLDVHFVSSAPVQSPLGVGAQHAAPLQWLAVY